MSDESDYLREKDPMRLCPECRMPISILANRCRYCGVTVGKPRKEVETLTVQDLGGENASNYTVSGNVMEALQSFMTEEQAAQETQAREREAAKSKWFKRRSADGKNGEQAASASLPPLDSAHSGLSSLDGPIGPSGHRSTSMPKKPDYAVGRKLFLVAGIMAGLVLLFLGTSYAWARIKEYNAGKNPQAFVYPNRALEMLAGGRPVTEALDDALEALKHNDTPENRAILEKVRIRVVEDVEARLNCVPFSTADMDSASALINRAGLRDTDTRIIKAMEKVNREMAYFKFVLTGINQEAGTATFRLNNPNLAEREQTVSEGELLQERFIVKKIGQNFVRLEDVKVTSPAGSPRTLMARVMSPVAAN